MSAQADNEKAHETMQELERNLTLSRNKNVQLEKEIVAGQAKQCRYLLLH